MGYVLKNGGLFFLLLLFELRGVRPRLLFLDDLKYFGRPPNEDNVESHISIASISSGRLCGILLVAVSELFGKLSSHPTFNNRRTPAYSTRVQEGTGDDSHSFGLSSFVVGEAERDEPYTGVTRSIVLNVTQSFLMDCTL